MPTSMAQAALGQLSGPGSLGDWEVFHYVIAGVFILASFLAMFSEDCASGSVRWSWMFGELLPGGAASPDVLGLESMLRKVGKGGRARVTDFTTELALAYREGGIGILLSSKMHEQVRRVAQWIYIKYLTQRAGTRRQLTYWFLKAALGIPIDLEEPERQSYLDVKYGMIDRKIWPYMWEIKDVCAKLVDCKGTKCIPMSSYSYLDMVRCQAVQDAAIDAARTWATGNHGPRMLGGNASILLDLEAAFAKFFNRDGCLIAATGYLACMSAVDGICGANDVMIYDTRCHASLQAGMKLNGGARHSFNHNDFRDCERLLRKYRHKYVDCWIIMESVYSMDGTIGNLPAAHALAKRYKARIIMDEAHGLGVLGKTGRGVEEYFNMPGACDMIVGTFSKSIGGIGGFVVGGKDVIDFLDAHSQGNLFSAPLTAYSAGGAIKCLELMQGKEKWRIARLQEMANFLRAALISGNGHWPDDYPNDLKYTVGGHWDTATIPIVFKNDMQRSMKVANTLHAAGWLTAAVAFPACPLNAPRLRITATAALDKQTANGFVKALVTAAVTTPSNKIA